MGGGAGVAGVAGGAGQHAPIPTQPQRNFRKVGVGSGVQVAAATGQPLLAPAPMQPFMPYSHPHSAPHPQPLQYQHMVRMYHGGGVGVGGSGVGGGEVGVGYAPPPVRMYHGGGVGVGGGEVGVAGVGYAPPPAPSPSPTPEQMRIVIVRNRHLRSCHSELKRFYLLRTI
ncbi:lysyl oxidase homolog 1-like [Ostrinia furnacalis]|uniref:lysyl oxidase homolog 1-like n=1 Tax=Ostrinia furnacalis TaxID=93504 RepID=UPI001039B519|nr:lysyl oxidase homolog 1-like [Ostrinia furnacalis]